MRRSVSLFEGNVVSGAHAQRCAPPEGRQTVHLSQIVSTRSSLGELNEKNTLANRYVLLFQISDTELL
jgi:hypothetical protein